MLLAIVEGEVTAGAYAWGRASSKYRGGDSVMQRAKLPAQPETWSVPLNLHLDFFAQMHTDPAALDDLTEQR
jgi:hypothetical protein